MENKKTIIIFAAQGLVDAANALKEKIQKEHPKALIILIDTAELNSNLFAKVMMSFIKPNTELQQTDPIPKPIKRERNIDKTRKFSLNFKNTVSYIRMRNILLRYKPDVIIMTGEEGLEEVTSARSNINSDAKVFFYNMELVFNLQLLNPYIDAYFVPTTESKDLLVQNNYPANNVYLASIPHDLDLEEEIPRVEANRQLELVDSKRTILFLFDEEGFSLRYKFLFKILSNYKDKFNILVRVRNNNDVARNALLNGLKVHDEKTVSFKYLLAAANAIVALPLSGYLSLCFFKKKLFVALDSKDKMGNKLIKVFDENIIETRSSIKLENFLIMYPDDFYENKRLNTANFEFYPLEKDFFPLIK